MSTYFEARSLDVYYDKVKALSGLSMVVGEGDIVAVIGTNGAGKTTMLRAFTGLTRVAAGEIWYQGKRIDQLNPDQIVSLGISMVPEGRHVYPLMNVRDNLLMGAFLRRDKVEVKRDLERMFERFPILKQRIRQQASTLSGGEQQMVAISRALMARPKLLLMDEPSLGLAPLVVRDIARSILSINREDQVSVILVEQNSRMALKLSSRAYVLETGRVALEGASDELVNNEEVRRLYLGA
ncbi:MAG: ABC transporter ATP-binding protein [Acidobacteria bacterium]|jgi:branched-chain amino acid transport system ATP-binding protein|nr:ABC transporter ATP-binding protein [Acidobacteriota bacterium]